MILLAGKQVVYLLKQPQLPEKSGTLCFPGFSIGATIRICTSAAMISKSTLTIPNPKLFQHPSTFGFARDARKK